MAVRGNKGEPVKLRLVMPENEADMDESGADQTGYGMTLSSSPGSSSLYRYQTDHCTNPHSKLCHEPNPPPGRNPGPSHKPPYDDQLRYIEDMAAELREMAARGGFEALSCIFDMARREAQLRRSE